METTTQLLTTAMWELKSVVPGGAARARAEKAGPYPAEPLLGIYMLGVSAMCTVAILGDWRQPKCLYQYGAG